MASSRAALQSFLADPESRSVLTGAGVSTGSGIPDYRDRDGNWKTAEPIQYGDFVASSDYRRRYWARSYVGWQRFSQAEPNAAHRALARLEASGKVDTVITQNVDGLHRQAGSSKVIDLHGNLARVRCLDCNAQSPRDAHQERIKDANPGWHAEVFRYKPDGDAELAVDSYARFQVPACAACGGMIKPDVVMFGEGVPKQRVAAAMAAVERTSALLVVGSSLMVFSGYRFARHASARNIPVAILNRGRTRADDIATLKIDGECAEILAEVAGPSSPDDGRHISDI